MPRFPANGAGFQSEVTGPVTLTALPPVSPAWGVPQTISNRELERVSAFDNFTAAERADVNGYTGSIDVTAKLQSIANALTNGGMIVAPPGKYLINGLVLPSGVGLVAGGYPGRVGQPSTQAHQIISTTTGWTIDTPSSASTGQFVVGLSFQGPGAGTSIGGVQLRNSNRAAVIGCMFNNYAEWAILQVAGLGCKFEANTAFNCLLDRTRATDLTTLPHGVIELRGTDNWVWGGEYTASLGVRPSAAFGASVVTGTAQAGAAGTIQLAAGASAVTNAFAGYLVEITSGTGAGEIGLCTSYDGATKTCTMSASWLTNPDATSVYSLTPCRCLAGAFKGTDNWVRDGMYETSEHGIYLANGATPHRLNGVNCDQNSGHGLIIDGSANIGVCTMSRNSAAVDGAYDDVVIIRPTSGEIGNTTTGSLASDTNQPRHGIHSTNDRAGADASRFTVRVSNRRGSRRGKMVKVEGTNGVQGVPGIELPGGIIFITSGTTPSLDGWKNVRLSYGAATNITAFTDLVDGESYTFTSVNANPTFVQGTSLKMISGANVTLSASQAYRFTAVNGVLYQA